VIIELGRRGRFYEIITDFIVSFVVMGGKWGKDKKLNICSWSLGEKKRNNTHL
jgi:hypothetical protein